MGIELVEDFLIWHVLRSIKTLPTLAATIGAIRREEQDPKFQ